MDSTAIHSHLVPPSSPSKKVDHGSSMPVDRSAAMGVETPPPSSPVVTSSLHPLASSSPLKLTSSPVKPSQKKGRQSVSSSIETTSGDPLAGLRALSSSEPLLSTDANVKATGISAPSITHTILGSHSHSLLIGRSKPSGQPHQSTTPAPDPLPASSQGLGSRPPQYVILPNTAKHVSRLHATIQWVPSLPTSSTPPSSSTMAGAFVVRILGQNGLIVDGKRRREGHVLRLTPGKTVLDFFGLAARFDVHPDAVAPLPDLVTSSSAKSRTTPRPSLGTSPSKKKARRSLASALAAVVSSSGGRTVKMPLSPASSSPPPAALASSSPSMRKVVSGKPASSLKRAHESSSEAEDDDDEDEIMAARADSPSLDRHVRGTRTQLRAGPRDEAMSEASSDVSEDEDEDDEDDEASSDAQISDSSSLTPEPEIHSADKKPRLIKNVRLAQRKAGGPASPAPAAQPPRRSSRSSHQRSSSAALMPPPPATSGSGRNTPVTTTAGNGSSEAQAAILQSLARQCVADLAPSYDLQGLLAGAIVFHRTATISASEAVRSVLASTPTLMKGEAGTLTVGGGGVEAAAAAAATDDESTTTQLKPGQRHPLWGAPTLLGPVGADGSTPARWESMARKAWREKLEMVLQEGSCFGIIQRAGKDSSGHDLECWYYYDREGDEDAERAANLGALAKPMRAALKTHKPIFWKKSAYGQASSSAPPSSSSTLSASTAAATQLVTESQLGSSSPALPLPTAAIQAGILSARPSSPLIASPSLPQGTSAADGASSISPKPSAQQQQPLRERKTLPNAALERIWDETQPEERERSWDPKGDADFAASKRRK